MGTRGKSPYLAILVTLAILGCSISVVEAGWPPQISGTGPPNIMVGRDYLFTPTVSAPDGDDLYFSIQNIPRWAQFSATTGALYGRPQAGDEGSYTDISISVSNGSIIDSLPGFTVTVIQTSLGSVTLSWESPTHNTDGSALTNLAGFNIYYDTSLGIFSNQITINNPGVTTYVVENLSPNTWYFVLTAVNSLGDESDVSNVSTKTIEAPRLLRRFRK